MIFKIPETAISVNKNLQNRHYHNRKKLNPDICFSLEKRYCLLQIYLIQLINSNSKADVEDLASFFSKQKLV